MWWLKCWQNAWGSKPDQFDLKKRPRQNTHSQPEAPIAYTEPFLSRWFIALSISFQFCKHKLDFFHYSNSDLWFLQPDKTLCLSCAFVMSYWRGGALGDESHNVDLTIVLFFSRGSCSLQLLPAFAVLQCLETTYSVQGPIVIGRESVRYVTLPLPELKLDFIRF